MPKLVTTVLVVPISVVSPRPRAQVYPYTGTGLRVTACVIWWCDHVCHWQYHFINKVCFLSFIGFILTIVLIAYMDFKLQNTQLRERYEKRQWRKRTQMMCLVSFGPVVSVFSFFLCIFDINQCFIGCIGYSLPNTRQGDRWWQREGAQMTCLTLFGP